MSSSDSGGRAGIIVLVVLMATIVGVFTQSERIIDWIKLRDYTPSAEIVEIVEQTTMTPAARHLFYINRPVLAEKAPFREKCPEYEATIVLGCYQHRQGGIYVLKVDEARLEGVEQVTSAHEMLHAGYERLSSKERVQVDGWLDTYARDELKDVRILETIKSYDKTEPGERLNEIHSIIGTEIAELPAQLENYYARYFKDQNAVAAYASQYQQAFTSLQDQIDAYDARLNEQSKRIKSNTQILADRRQELENNEQQLQASQRSGDIERYNAGVATYNQMVADYNTLLEQTRSLIGQHNQLVVERNAAAAQTIELRQAIDSSALPASQ